MIVDGCFISFVVPVYNNEKTIIKCLNSIMNSIPFSYEIICINDNSQDRSLELLSKYKSLIEHFVIVDKSFWSGAGGGRNIGIDLARGKYVWFVDADDCISDDSGKILKDWINYDIDIICFDLFQTDKRYPEVSYRLNKQHCFSNGNEFLKCAGRNKSIRASVCTQIYSLKLIKSLNIKFDESVLVEDASFCLETFLVAKKVLYLKNAMYIYNRKEEGIDLNKRIKYYLGFVTACIRMKEMFDLILEDDELKKHILDYILHYKAKADNLERDLNGEEYQLIKAENKQLFEKWNNYFECNSYVSSTIS